MNRTYCIDAAPGGLRERFRPVVGHLPPGGRRCDLGGRDAVVETPRRLLGRIHDEGRWEDRTVDSAVSGGRERGMSIGEDSGPIHPIPTRRNGLRYLFYDKHHGRGPRDAACWLPTLGGDEEFAVFDDADWNELSDEDGRLYGIRRRDGSRTIPCLGTWGQIVAEFPLARPGQPWHGYPLWPLGDEGPKNRRGESGRPSRSIFARMKDAGLITDSERRRLLKGDHL